MSCKCCSTSNVSKEIETCPLCHSKSEKVGEKTVLSLLKEESQLLLDNQKLYYCNNHSCDLVYFSENQRFYKSDIKINIDDKVCFCFDISKAEFKEEGKDKTLNKININMKNIGCNCDTKNPSGKCCTIQIKRNY
jgi:rRNA-processing protein FCF1